MSERVRFIEDLPEDWQSLISFELASVGRIWREQSDRLSKSDAIKDFNRRLGREWAIETGIIEGLYTLDRGVTQLLIERGIAANLIPDRATDQPTELVVAIVGDQEEALEGLFDFVSHAQELTTSYIKQLHQVFTRHQDTVKAVGPKGMVFDVHLLKGAWKQQPNNPTRPDGTVYYYTPPEHVSSEMDRLLEFHRRHESFGVAPEVEAAWLHHRFTQIHPFQDGNGRIARTLASLIFIRAGFFPLVITRDTRSEYIAALERADDGDLSDLTGLFAKMQVHAFRQAISISEPLLRQNESISDMIAAGVKSLKEKQLARQRLQGVFTLADSLKNLALLRFDEPAVGLNQELKGVQWHAMATADESKPESRHWFRQETVEIAKFANHSNPGYHPDLLTYSEWVRLVIRIDGRTTNIVVSLHSVGVEFIGVLVASAFIEFRDAGEHQESRIDGPYPISSDVFQFGYDEEPSKVKERFDAWVNEVILVGLDEWRKHL